MDATKKQWETPQVESLEILAPKCTVSRPQADNCKGATPVASAPCHPNDKGIALS